MLGVFCATLTNPDVRPEKTGTETRDSGAARGLGISVGLVGSAFGRKLKSMLNVVTVFTFSGVQGGRGVELGSVSRAQPVILFSVRS
jgi:hypothetical protein